MELAHAQLLSHGGRYAFLVAGEHDGFPDANGMQGRQGWGGIGLDAVANNNMAGINAVYGHMDDGAFVVARAPGGTYCLHELAVAHRHFLAVDGGHNAMSRRLLDVRHGAVVLLVGVGIPQGHGYGMGRMPLHVRCQVQKFLIGNHFRMHRRHLKHAFREGAGFVEHHRLQLGKLVHEVGAFDEDALLGRAAQAAKKSERYGNYQRARTGYHQEQQAAVNPGGPLAGNDAGNHGNQHRQRHYNGGIDFCKTRDEALAPGLVLSGILHQVQDFGGGGFAEGLGGAHAQNARLVHAAGENFIALRNASGHAFAGQCHGIQAGVAIHDNAVHRHFFSRLNDDDLAHPDLFRLHGDQVSGALHMGGIGPNVHQVRDGFAAIAFRLFLEPFAQLEEQHHKHRLRELRLGTRQKADAKRADGGHAHEEVFAQGLAVEQALGRLLQGVPAHYQIRDEVQEQVLPGLPGGVFFDDYRADEQHGGRDDFC